MSWLLRDGDVLAAVELRRRSRAEADGVVVLTGLAVVHTLRHPEALDLAWCGRAVRADGAECLEVRRIRSVGPRRLARPKVRAGRLVVARSGAFERWKLRVGDLLEIREVRPPL